MSAIVKWQYLIEPAGNINLPGKLEQLGAEGWELVTIFQAWAYFKRPLVETKTRGRKK